VQDGRRGGGVQSDFDRSEADGGRQLEWPDYPRRTPEIAAAVMAIMAPIAAIYWVVKMAA
jgi:hypothetical protein